MRVSQGGTSLAMNDDDCYSYYNARYSGGNMLVGVSTDGGQVKGCFFLEDIDFRNRRCYMHLTFDPDFIKVKQACTMCADYIFNEVHLLRIYGIISEKNHMAKTLVNKMGWVMAGTLPEYFSTPEGWASGLILFLDKNNRRF